jgi:hypothetical protein
MIETSELMGDWMLPKSQGSYRDGDGSMGYASKSDLRVGKVVFKDDEKDEMYPMPKEESYELLEDMEQPYCIDQAGFLGRSNGQDR